MERRTTITRGVASRRGIQIQAHTRVTLKRGAFDCYVFCEPDRLDKEHVALVRGKVAGDVMVPAAAHAN